ncbi:hypothetical protein E4U39_000051 [Claviceps sp. Clav50 group G5]|nr:hypothetical protein E4U39_000051 [Claviceps sp. Clav50 group G5]
MGQYWEIAALGSETVLPKVCLKLGEFLFQPCVAQELERALAVPVEPTYQDSRPKNMKSHHSAAGVTNRYFWSIAREYIVRDFMQSLGVWAGQQLITVGDYNKVDDYPPGLFATEENKENLLKRRPEDEESEDEESEDEESEDEESEDEESEDEESEDEGSEDEVDQLSVEQRPLTLYHRIRRSFTELPRVTRAVDRDFSILDAIYQNPCYRTMENVFLMKGDDFYPRDEVWILRNLTTHQYVRREPLELQPGLAHGPFVRGIGFGCVVLSRISWSSDSNVALHDPTGRIHRGLWAGHRFDITTMTRHEKLTAGQNWIDVTEELVEEVTAIWSVAMGPNWKQEVLRQHRTGWD